MSLFIANLAFTDANQLGAAKAGVLIGSAVSAVAGCVLLLIFLRKPPSALTVNP